ncbi:MAG: Type 1 glutamine amidotransferase-like domain-containing protein [Planctomycetes bacterium]|nr:Type 1 glutamine amidotransferase-like domain-containing protein [Planctomycetota bacterium]
MQTAPCYLVSGHDPFYGGTAEIDKAIFGPRPQKRGKILFVPASGSEMGQRQYAEKFKGYADSKNLDMLSIILPEVTVGSPSPMPLPGQVGLIRRFPDGKFLRWMELAEIFESADYIYLGGGRPEHLYYAFMYLRLFELLVRANQRGAPIIGYSAGAYFLSDRWWELSGSPLFFRKGEGTELDNIEEQAMLGFRRVHVPSLIEESPLMQMLAYGCYGPQFDVNDFEEEGYIRLFYCISGGSGYIENFFCRVHFELKHEDLSEFYLIKENFPDYCVTKLEDPEMVAVKNGGLFDLRGEPVRSVFTGHPVKLSEFKGMGAMSEHVNNLPEALAGRFHLLPPAEVLGGVKNLVRYYPVTVKGEQRTHHLFLDADGNYCSENVSKLIFETLLATNRLQAIYPQSFPLRF